VGLQLELQIATSEPGIPSTGQMQGWLDTWFANLESATVVVKMVDMDEAAQLNEAYRHKQGPTNVLSFPFDPPEMIDSDHLGDLVICAPVVAKEALEQGKEAQAHWAHMLLHGTLHLFGYDHITESDAEEMEALEVAKLELLGIPNPYQA